jgi:ABC-2 type transport system permease protein
MKKILLIAWKDLALIFYDRAAWILMLAAPFALTLGLGAVTGAFSGGGSGPNAIPIVIANQDDGPFGEALVQAFYSEGLSALFSLAETGDLSEARRQVEDDLVAAAIIVPAGFSAGLTPALSATLPDALIPEAQTGQAAPPAVPVEIYANPGWPVSSGLVQSVVTEIVDRIQAIPVSERVIVEQLLAGGRLSPQDLPAYAAGLTARLAAGMSAPDGPGVSIAVSTGLAQPDEPQVEPSVLAYLAPGMAVFFLMYTVTQGSRSILNEREQGTLARLLTTPTSNAQVLGGKVLGVYLGGLAQVGVLIAASGLLFGLGWGDPLGVACLVLAVTAAATGWGILVASFARHPYQVTGIGMALMLLFGVLSGVFIPASSFSEPVRLLSRITPNAWAMDGFTILAGGGSLADLRDPLLALLALAAVLFVLAVGLSRRRWASGFTG